ncbi:hypothetical protein XU18_3312 [Perkinsela sp. CCAP 1560/4]|nr:hypothetical protein XU18_5036 [Perkinsela sp. CCAP 1560/4]KNH05644.1 hypothetical protein XU18_3312 [Perkinsela sp. CCAP 1560/4]|eukprot:KNH03632.1 hypothetical protein XU18_5036 [Perkinsela sp. CCAP 1560/4]
MNVKRCFLHLCRREANHPAQLSQVNQVSKQAENKRVASTNFFELYEKNQIDNQSKTDDSLLQLDCELFWKNKLMFDYEFKRSPKHLSWTELGKEVECLECSIDADKHRPEEVYHVAFHFRNLKTGIREKIFEASNDVAEGEGLCDLLAAVGTCLTRPEVHRTIRFDAGRGKYRDINIRKNSKYTSEVIIGFRPFKNIQREVKKKRRDASRTYPLPKREQMKYVMTRTCALINQARAKREKFSKVVTNHPVPAKTPVEIAFENKSKWGYHSRLLDAEMLEDDPPGTYHLAISAHALGCVVIRAIEKLIQRPLSSFYRSSQMAQNYVVDESESLGVAHAVYGWLGFEDKVLPHYTPLEAVQRNWLGPEASFSLTAIICKIRELCNLTKKNPETLSWISVRYKDTSLALRNISAKLGGAGPSRLFWPASYNPSINLMLPKAQRKTLRTRVSIAGFLGFSDQTKNLPNADTVQQLSAKSQN